MDKVIQTQPIIEYVVKVASRCNINCDYCYEYNLGDDSWRQQPKRMSLDVCRSLAARIAEHCARHAIDEISISFHGGEPLMVGHKMLDNYCRIFSEQMQPIKLHFGMQTNAMLINEWVTDVVLRHNIDVSVSLDGDQTANDRHRLDHQGKTSHARTVQGLRLLIEKAPDNFSGILAVLDVKNDPIATLDYLSTYNPANVDFLLPHHTWECPPIRPNNSDVAYGEWYWRLYQEWVGGRWPQVSIRFLTSIISQLAGGKGIYEAMNLAPCQLIVVSADGSMEAVDSIKATASGQQYTGLNVQTATFDEALQKPVIYMRQTGKNQLCEICQKCCFVKECAGGYFPHRYSSRNGFLNPSVYCKDLYWLIDKIKDDLIRRKHGQCS